MKENETHDAADLADPRAPMAAAPMRYDEDGNVDWGNMWDSFCVLAREGGPSHRETLLMAATAVDITDPAYQAAAQEIGRGIQLVSELVVEPAEPGWLAVRCHSPGMATWLSEAIGEENVAARADGERLLVPVAAEYQLKGEIKSVITAVAKCTHYWRLHLPAEVKQTLAAQELLGDVWRKLRRLWPG